MLLVIIAIIVVVAILANFFLALIAKFSIDEDENVEQPEKSLSKIEKMVEDSEIGGTTHISKDEYSAYIIDEENKNIKLFYSDGFDSNNNPIYKTFEGSFNDIVEVEVVVDEHSISKTSRGSQIGGMAVGGLLLGGLGAIIGGLSGSRKKVIKIQRMSLKLVVNSYKNPIIRIDFLGGNADKYNYPSKTFKTDSKDYKQA